MERLQTNVGYADLEHNWIVHNSCTTDVWKWKWGNLKQRDLRNHHLNPPDLLYVHCPKVAVVRGEGSNGDKEMCAVLHHVGFHVVDVTTSDLVDGRILDLSDFQVLVFVGGFTYSDVLGAGTGWAAVLQKNTNAKTLLQNFIARPDTLVLGVCNGFQLLCKLGWIKGTLTRNLSGRFESRFVHVTVPKEAPDCWFKNMQDASTGVWVAHGEGCFESTPDATICALQYCDLSNNPTDMYPINPNGSTNGIAGVTSKNGRILGLRPFGLFYIKKNLTTNARYDAASGKII